eukprot:COSAG02_NODE_440_length_22296_cov_173.657386_14_plen_134_part_00
MRRSVAFTLDTTTAYDQTPTESQTITLSRQLSAKWGSLLQPPKPRPCSSHVGVKLDNQLYADGNGPRTAANATECCAICDQDPACKHWSYQINASLTGAVCHWATLTHCCWLHTSDANPVKAEGWTSDVLDTQ